ncbi:hypothetical protein X794_00770 [Dehalococcoides mccartyi CG5]|nr:hypothetical protein X794_00770 [Dehalococcoides mccartyi CG5]
MAPVSHRPSPGREKSQGWVAFKPSFQKDRLIYPQVITCTPIFCILPLKQGRIMMGHKISYLDNS